MGSVKDLVVLKQADENTAGTGEFVFSDRYSVFDWGKMPDDIPDKGKSICIATAFFFEKLEEMGIKTHYLGVVENGRLKRLQELEFPQNIIRFRLLRVIKPEVKDGEYDYSIYQKERTNLLIPLEIIYRNSLPSGSSVFRRLKEGSLKLEELGLKIPPVPGQILEKPILDVSTKLEATDRYLNWEEAKKICGLEEGEVDEIKKTTLKINEIITAQAERIGLFNEDGKVEFGFDEERNLVLVDAVGTLDECRFTYRGIPVSKEIARIYYRKSDWYQEVESAKKKDKVNWKSLVQSQPQPLPQRFLELISLTYKAYANELTQRKWFPTPPLREILEEIKQYI